MNHGTLHHLVIHKKVEDVFEEEAAWEERPRETDDSDEQSDEDDEAAVDKEPVCKPPPVPAAPPPAGHLMEYTIKDEAERVCGTIKVDLKRSQFNAHCCELGGAGRKDHRTSTMKECRANRTSAKRPLGYLIQWLRQGCAYENREDHKLSSMLITYDDRVECRRWLREQAELLPLLRQEAEWLGLAWAGAATVVEDT